ncbi:hypothetical protein TNCV_3722751 [Trichonephila clavipes]|nr:hypothetical protein TNCV_3722751 [Trichonephila clavipes]
MAVSISGGTEVNARGLLTFDIVIRAMPLLLLLVALSDRDFGYVILLQENSKPHVSRCFLIYFDTVVLDCCPELHVLHFSLPLKTSGYGLLRD